jgi:predicted nucleic acid-binding Zn ribbon protein
MLSAWDVFLKREEEMYYCSDTCRRGIDDFMKQHNQFGKFMMILLLNIFLFVLLFVLLYPRYRYIVLISESILLGIFLVKLPSALPMIYKWLGMKRSVMAVRVLGVGAILVGVVGVVKYFVA